MTMIAAAAGRPALRGGGRLCSLDAAAARAASSSSVSRSHYDVLIVGGGAVGSALANALAGTGTAGTAPSVKVGLIESRGPPPPLSAYGAVGGGTGTEAAAEDRQGPIGALPNARAYALSPASLELIDGGGATGRRRSGSGGGGLGGGDRPPGPVARLDSAGRVAWYDAMQVWESDGPATLHFHSSDLDPGGATDPHSDDMAAGGDGAGYKDVLGAVVEDGPLVSALWDEIRRKNDDGDDGGAVDLICDASVRRIAAPRPPPGGSSGGLAPPPPVELTYEVKRGDADADADAFTATCTASLLVAADGANSYVRRTLGMPTVGFGYGRRAVTCTVRVSRTMGRTAYQRFMPHGPMALLPVWKEEADGRGDVYANIVWSTTPERCAELREMSDEEFVAELNDCMQSGPTNTRPLFPPELTSSLPGPLAGLARGIDALARGANDGLTMSAWSEKRPFSVPPTIGGIVGPRLAFDLSLAQARRYVGPRVALVGDAAHTVHPMAGQGLNLGLGDAECLARVVREAADSGMDAGGTDHFLGSYESERRAEVAAALGGIHALHEAFGTTFGPAVFARSLGMNLVNAAGPVRRTLAEVAAGRRGTFTGLRC